MINGSAPRWAQLVAELADLAGRAKWIALRPPADETVTVGGWGEGGPQGGPRGGIAYPPRSHHLLVIEVIPSLYFHSQWGVPILWWQRQYCERNRKIKRDCKPPGGGLYR